MKKIFFVVFLFLIGIGYAKEYGVIPTEIYEATPSSEGKPIVLCFFNKLNEDLIFITRSGSIAVEEKNVVVSSGTTEDKCLHFSFNYKPIKNGVFYVEIISVREPSKTIGREVVSVKIPEGYVENPKPIQINPPANILPLQGEGTNQNTNRESRPPLDGWLKNLIFFGIGFGFGILITVIYAIFF